MGTRSRIGVMHGDKLKSVYCHWDGYLQHNGLILQNHYDSAKANHLVSLGNISGLREEIGVEHPFSMFDVTPNLSQAEYYEKYDKMTTFYGRDRKETDTDFTVNQSYDEFQEQCNDCDAEYHYIMKDGVWYVGVAYATDNMVPGKLYVLAEKLTMVEA